MSHDPLVQPRERPGAGSGLFALTDCARSTALFTIPASALINIKTLAPLYPDYHAFSAVRLISLHLALGRTRADPVFGPYIDTLPRNFDFHPLTWLLDSEDRLISALPPSAMDELNKLAARFRSDWQQVVNQTHDVAYRDFLWAWLIVNTRCIYYPIHARRSHPDNLTLCPLLDFANHSSFAPSMHISDLGSADGITVRSSPDAFLARGEELYLKYGSHCNRKLLVDYGFTEQVLPGDDTLSGEVDLQDIFTRLVAERSSLAQRIQTALEQDGYWGDWSIYAVSGSVQASFRLITALRLLQIPDNEFVPEMLEKWRQTHLGLLDELPEEHEKRWKRILLEICAQVVDRATRWLDEHSGSDDMAFIRNLWQEECFLAQAVLASPEYQDTSSV